MNDPAPSGNRNAPANWLLGAGVFIAAASAGFLLLFGFIVRVPAYRRGSQVVVPLVGLLVGGTLIGIALSKRSGRSTIVPAFVTLVCALLLTGGAGYGYASTCNFEGPNDTSNGAYLALAFAGVVFCVVSVLWLFVAIIVRAFRKRPGPG